MVTMPAPVLCFKETAKGLVLSRTNQDALQALFGDDVTGCKQVLLEPMPMRVADRERLTAVRVPSRRDGRHPHQGRAGEQENRPEGAERRREPMVSVGDAKGERCRHASFPYTTRLHSTPPRREQRARTFQLPPRSSPAIILRGLVTI
jgi:hypothetical protein